jgi:hypothetical protein
MKKFVIDVLNVDCSWDIEPIPSKGSPLELHALGVYTSIIFWTSSKTRVINYCSAPILRDAHFYVNTAIQTFEYSSERRL